MLSKRKKQAKTMKSKLFILYVLHKPQQTECIPYKAVLNSGMLIPLNFTEIPKISSLQKFVMN